MSRSLISAGGSTPRASHSKQPTLRQGLSISLAAIFAVSSIVVVIAVVFLIPRLSSIPLTLFYLTLLLLVNVSIVLSLGRYLIRRRLLSDLDELVEGAEAIAAGDYGRRLPLGGTEEIRRVADAVNRMAERLISHQAQLVANVKSLEETNRLLTEARDELVHVEKAASVGRLSAGIAHEVGNPLSAIMGYISLLQRDADPKEVRWLESIEEEARRIDRIVHGLLDYARPREARVRPIAVNDVIDRSLELLSLQGRFQAIEIVPDLAPDLPLVEADPYQLEQVIVNLLLNASDAVEQAQGSGRQLDLLSENGARPLIEVETVSVEVAPPQHQPARRRDDPPDVDYSHRRRLHRSPRLPREFPIPSSGGEVVEIRVRDSGGGISDEVLEHIFEPFVTTKDPGRGTGLGLAVSARLIDAMEGTIRVESEVGKGTEFTVVLPAWAGDPTEAEDIG